MSEQIHGGTAIANLRGAKACSLSDTMLRLISTVRALWPHKTVTELRARTGRSERQCQYWLARRYEISIDDLAELLRGDQGLAFLEAMMGDARPGWWKAFKKQVRLAETNRRLNEMRRELDRLNSEDD
jgi:hypothetical protein